MYKLKPEHHISVYYPVMHPMADHAVDKDECRRLLIELERTTKEYYEQGKLEYLKDLSFICSVWHKPRILKAHLNVRAIGWEGDSYSYEPH